MKTNQDNFPDREIHEEVRTDNINGQPNGHVTTTRTSSSIPSTADQSAKETARHNGYVQGAISENIRQGNVREDVQDLRDNENAGRGLLVGLVIASVAGLVLASVYFLNRQDPSPVIVPTPRVDRPAATSPTKTIERERTIIERTEKAVPVPQSSGSVRVITQPSSTPNVNITVPNSQGQNGTLQVVPLSPSDNINTPVPNSEREPLLPAPTPLPQSPPTVQISPGAPNPTTTTPTRANPARP
jgi:hypothetical protein